MRRRRDGGTGGATEASTATGSARTARWPWLLAFAAVTLALIVGAVVAVVAQRSSSAVEDLVAAREAASATATRFTRRANVFTSDDAEAYESSVVPLLTTSYSQEWRTKVSELRAYEEQGATVSSTVEITGTAVVTADADSATVLVVADTRVEVQDSPLIGALRWEVDLFNVDGRWLVNDYRRVGPGGVIS